jgi:hypothetical protein
MYAHAPGGMVWVSVLAYLCEDECLSEGALDVEPDPQPVSPVVRLMQPQGTTHKGHTARHSGRQRAQSPNTAREHS